MHYSNKWQWPPVVNVHEILVTSWRSVLQHHLLWAYWSSDTFHRLPNFKLCRRGEVIFHDASQRQNHLDQYVAIKHRVFPFLLIRQTCINESQQLVNILLVLPSSGYYVFLNNLRSTKHCKGAMLRDSWLRSKQYSYPIWKVSLVSVSSVKTLASLTHSHWGDKYHQYNSTLGHSF